MKKSLAFHVHTEMSNISCGFRDSINKVEELLDYAYSQGFSGLTITDHECVSAHMRAVNWYKNKMSENENFQNEFKLLLGNEIYIAREGLTKEKYENGENFFHFVLVALDEEGQKQLRELSTIAWKQGFFKYVPRRYNTFKDLMNIIGNNQGHVIASTACLANVAAALFQQKDKGFEEKIDNYIELIESIFGKENTYLEISPALYKEQKDYNKFMVERYKDKKFIVGVDAHYLTKEDYDVFKIVLNSNRMGNNRNADDYYKYAYLMQWKEIEKNLNYLDEDFVESCRLNGEEIAAKAQFYDLGHKIEIPKVDYPTTKAPQKLLELASKYEHLNKYINSPYEADNVLINQMLYNMPDLINEEHYNRTLERANIELNELWLISEKLDVRVSDYLLTVAKVVDIIWEEVQTIVGPGRGSAVAWVTNYLLGITQVNPLEYPLEIPHWRFLSAERPELPDIDIDSWGAKKPAILEALDNYFNSRGGEVVQVLAYGTETTKKAIKTAARGLNISDDIANYITSLVPSERGMQLSLSQCYFGDDDHAPVTKFVQYMNDYPELWTAAQKIENLTTAMGVHAAGIMLSNEPIVIKNSVMQTKDSKFITAYDLHESEETGLIKIDALSVDGLGKLQIQLYQLLQDGLIEWKGSLKETYKYYLWPNKLKPTQEVWDNIAANKVNSLWQLNTQVGMSALENVKANSIEEIGAINSLMRLMPQKRGDPTPINIFVQYRENIELWYQEMREYGLNEEEIKIMEDHLLPLYGVADTQEAVMKMVVDPRIAGFTVAEANLLRKSIAKKSIKAQDEAKELLFKKGAENGTRKQLLNYVWGVQIHYSLGYSFSLPHVAAYSYIALQQAVMYTNYPSIYWDTSCLIVDAGSFSDEDFQGLIDEGILIPGNTYFEILDADSIDEVDIETSAINRDKVATSIAEIQQFATITAPDINTSGFGFTANVEENTIKTGLKLVAKLGDKFIYNIIQNRPYKNLNDFLSKVKISKDRVVNLIKAGAFRRIENKSNMELLEEYVRSVSDQKKRLTGQNIGMLIRENLLPQDLLSEQIKTFNWWKYATKGVPASQKDILLDLNALRFYESKYDEKKIFYDDKGNSYITKVYGKSLYDADMNVIKEYIKEHHDELLNKLNEQLFLAEWNKYKMDTESQGEMQSIRMYTGEHELTPYNLPVHQLDDLEDNLIVGEFKWAGRVIPEYQIYRIAGTVVAKNTLKETITLLTEGGPITIKFWKDSFAHYNRKITEVRDGKKYVVQNSFFDVGTFLLIYGRLSEGQFLPKYYKRKQKISDVCFKINLQSDGKVTTEEKMKDEDSNN